MHDQGIETRPPLRLEYPGNGMIIPRIPAKAIDRFSRKGDKPARRQNFRRILKAVCIWHQYSGGLGHWRVL
jgi:hypothetical protein